MLLRNIKPVSSDLSFPRAYQSQRGRNHRHLLHGHLRHHIKGGEVGIGKVVFVLAHLDSIQPLVHGTEAGEVWDAAVQEREMNPAEEKHTKVIYCACC